MTNTLYYGDNLDVLRRYVPDESVDLVYLDPPFNSNASYNVLFKERSGEESPAQIKAFTDTWEWTQESERTFEQEIVLNPETPPNVKEMVSAFRQFIGSNAMMAYLVMMTPRLVQLRRVLKPTGSIYLHCDPTASHYLKLLMDAVFGKENFRTEITWKRTSAHSDTRQGRQQHGRVHDLILFYSKSGSWTWNAIYTEYDQSYVDQFYRHVESGTGRRYRLGDLTGPGGAAKGNPSYEVLGVTRYWRYSKDRMAELLKEGRVVQTRPGAVPAYKRYLDEMPGVPLQDLWTDIRPIASQARERLGYPTQKPQALLERIIEASSNEGDVVLDPFCGVRHGGGRRGEAEAQVDGHRRHAPGCRPDEVPSQDRLRHRARQRLRGRRRAGGRRRRPRPGGAGQVPVPVLGHVPAGGVPPGSRAVAAPTGASTASSTSSTAPGARPGRPSCRSRAARSRRPSSAT